MHLDVAFMTTALRQIAPLAQAAEALGFGAAWTSETQHDPFLPLALIAEHTQRLQLGTAVAIGFARSPMTLAHTAWDLAAQSNGRFILGLGTQVKPHIERRFGMPWPESPVNKLRELVLALRAIWQTWQTGAKLNVRGEYFKLTLMTPFFSPGPIAHPHIPIYIAGVNTGLARLGGEVCDGFHVHPFHTADYLRAVLRPALAEGAAKAGRAAEQIAVAASVFTYASPAERDAARGQVAFYASTPTYRPVLEHHGWGEVGERLSALAAQGAWGEMPKLISDAMLDEFALAGAPAELAGPLRARYAGLVDRVTLYQPFLPGAQDSGWQTLARELA
ncbi:MAG: TIGR03617 family F420-dependent LLM class oxidoreductase [Anaerolineales bacterium]|nr:TIGR03617 family F420-dependent LLM class oxidoreductase [Anaerolineales bacterium]